MTEGESEEEGEDDRDGEGAGAGAGAAEETRAYRQAAYILAMVVGFELVRIR